MIVSVPSLHEHDARADGAIRAALQQHDGLARSDRFESRVGSLADAPLGTLATRENRLEVLGVETGDVKHMSVILGYLPFGVKENRQLDLLCHQ